jgi:predicted GTPase
MDGASTANEPSPRDFAATIGRIEEAVQSVLGVESPLSARMRSLHRRFVSERLQIAVLGQFKRGKSTFINPLLGVPLLPTGIVPLTAVATFIAWRAEPLIVVVFAGDRPSRQLTAQTPDEIRRVLFNFVAEEANPKNQLRVARVELYYPAAILADGIVVIDTPGAGSTLTHNLETALHVLPESDAAFFVLSADPPITEAELHYVQVIKPRVPSIFLC